MENVLKNSIPELEKEQKTKINQQKKSIRLLIDKHYNGDYELAEKFLKEAINK